MVFRSRLFVALAVAAVLTCASVCRSDDGHGKLTGVVIDAAGTPQMGATIWLTPETSAGRTVVQLLSDQQGVFVTPRISPGLYSVRVTLAGFLPTLQQHIRVTANLTTVLHVELDSVFASLDQLRRQSNEPAETGDWKWVLRTSAASRPVLQLRDGAIVIADNNPAADLNEFQPRARLEMTNGSVYPGSPSALPGSFTTAISYDQTLRSAGRLLIAGQMGYGQIGDQNGGFGAGLATIWVPSGDLAHGPETTVVMKQGRFAAGDRTKMMRVEHSEQMALSDRVAIAYGGEYLMGGVGSTHSSVRPHARVDVKASPGWTVAFLLETNPDAYRLALNGPPLESAIDALGTLPLLLFRQDGSTVLSGDWHEEAAVNRSVGNSGSVEAAAFYDYSRHQAVFGYGDGFGMAPEGFISPGGVAHDAGAGGSPGARVVYREKLTDNWEVAAVYTWAGVLSPDSSERQLLAQTALEDVLRTRMRHSLAGKISGKLPASKTQLTVGYKWLDGTAVSRQDLFGEAALGIDPYLSVSIRQPLPSFGALGHWEALADFRNVLSQGCVPVDSAQGGVTLLPVARSFRGGISFQF